MEAQFRGKAQAYGPVVTDSKAAGKRSLEWDLNDWKWDGDLLVASSLNPVSGDCRSSQFLPVMTETPLNNAVFHSSSLYGGGTNIAQENGKNELEKRIVIMEEDEAHEEAVALNLKLGGKSYPLVDDEVDKWEGGSGKKTKVAGNANIPSCQVENCGADLTNAKDYHRRHKVCEMHSKATQALVGNVTQRFCQQCSRFHALQEFDEGKRSCRRRLAGHNRRRRKTHPETAVNAESLNGEKLSSYLLISLLRVLSNLHSNESNQSKDQDLLSQLLRNLQGETNGTSIPGLAQGPQAQGVPNIGTSTVPHEKDPSRDEQHFAVPSNEAQKGLSTHNPPGSMLQNPSEVQGRVPATCDMVPARQNVQETLKRYNIDLNNVCIDSQDCLDEQELAHASVGVPFWAQKDSLKSSPPQTSRNSGSTSTQSPSSSSGSDSQSRTDRIIFKLFGKDPGDLPHLLRNQLLQWLSQSPTDIEGYIRPGCIVLTIYLRLNKTSWEELCCQLCSKLSRLLDMPNDNFWRTGWIYTRVQHSMAFVCDGRVVLETPLTLRSYKNCQIASISPIAVPASKTVQFVVRGYNVSQSMSRLLCALNGNYLVEESCSDLLEDADTLVENNDIQCLSFSCSIPNIAGRGFIEVEDSGMRGSFFPFIVADADVCSEICTLERIIESAETCEDLLQGQEAGKMEPKAKALEFIHEMGWLLHRSSSNIRLHHVEGFGECFPFERFKWLLDFSMEHAWPAVLKKLLDLLFIGVVDSGAYPSAENALQEMGLLHHAVRKNSRCLVECLLAYVPENSSRRLECKEKQTQYGQVGSFLYRPDAMGPGRLTPLHLAASSSGFEDVLDALLEDPGMMGIEAWKTARDSAGLTPSDYASLRGHYSYINLVQQKTQRKPNEGQVAVDIPDSRAQTKHSHNLKSAGVHSFHTEKLKTLRSRDWQCNVCERKLRYGRAGTAFAYRPAMLSMVAVAAVCVCVALLFKTLPVVYVCQPFRWEALKYGAM